MAVQVGRTTLAHETKTVKVGDVAPDFSLSTHSNETFRLRDLRGKKHAVLVFFRSAWTGV